MNMIPQSIDEAVDRIIELGQSIFENYITEAEDEHHFAISLHHTLGRWIRNNWRLWEKKGALYEEFKEMDYTHPDDMSHAILTRVYKKYTEEEESKLG